MSVLADLIESRHSVRAFHPHMPPRGLIDEAFTLAAKAPSNSNTQPWKVWVATGAARDRLCDSLLAEARIGEPQIPPLPIEFEHYRSLVGAALYGAMGIDRDDDAGRREALLRNWDFFGAPIAAVVCMDRHFDYSDALGVGMFLQNLILLLTERGWGCCVQVSIAGYPHVVRDQLGIDSRMRVLCGLAIGQPDLAAPVNRVRIARDHISDHVFYRDS